MTTESGLDGIIAGETAISTVGQHTAGLSYRGYSIEDLASSVSFEEVAYLLIYNHLPNQIELDQYQQKLMSLRELPASIKNLLELIPGNAHPMDVLRTACSMLGTIEPETHSNNAYDISDRLLALFPGIMLYWYHFHHGLKKRINTCLPNLTMASYILELLQQRTPDKEQVRALDVSLILYAEHEFNASTFAARVTASTLSDFYSAICTAIGTLRGPLHGGANEQALKLILSFNSPKEAEIEIQNRLQNKELIMGFGHRVYQNGDPRSNIIKAWAYKLAEKKQLSSLFAVCETIEHLMLTEKKLFPNLDFYSAATYYCCDIPINLFTPIFVMSRITGWAAHVIEQRQHNKLIRPIANYIGHSQQTLLPLKERS